MRRKTHQTRACRTRSGPWPFGYEVWTCADQKKCRSEQWAGCRDVADDPSVTLRWSNVRDNRTKWGNDIFIKVGRLLCIFIVLEQHIISALSGEDFVLGKFTWEIGSSARQGMHMRHMSYRPLSWRVFVMCCLQDEKCEDVKTRCAWLQPLKEVTADLSGGRGPGKSTAMATTTRERERASVEARLFAGV